MITVRLNPLVAGVTYAENKGCHLADGLDIIESYICPSDVPFELPLESIHKTPEKRFLLGVLSEAWDSAWVTVRNRKQQRQRDEARRWFLDLEDRSPHECGYIAFRWVAAELGLTYAADRARLQLQKEKWPASAHERRCVRCETIKPLNHFHYSGNHYSGVGGARRSTCKECVAALRRAGLYGAHKKGQRAA